MATKTLHPKIKALQVGSKPINYYDVPGAEIGTLQERAAQRAAKIEKGDNQDVCYFCVWGVRDDRGTGWLKGAFSKSIQDRGPKSKANQKIISVWYHDLTDPIGKVVDMGEDDFGAWALIEWADFDAVPSAKRAKSLIDSEIVNGWSFGFDYVWDKMVYDEKADTVWIKEADLYEISPLPFGSLKETLTVRSKDEYDSLKLSLDEHTNIILSGLPRQKQLEIRQLLTRHISLAKVEPDSLDVIKGKTLKQRKPKSALVSRLNKQLSKTEIY